MDFESELNDELETQLKSLRQTVTMQSTPAPPQEDAEPAPKAGEFYDDHYFDSDDEETGGQAQRDQGKPPISFVFNCLKRVAFVFKIGWSSLKHA